MIGLASRLRPRDVSWLTPVLVGGLLAAATIGVALWTPGCGGKDLCFGCNPSDGPTSTGDGQVRIAGNIRGIVGGAPVDQVRVVICLGLLSVADGFGACPPEDFTVGPLLTGNDYGPLFVLPGNINLAFVWDQAEDGYSTADPIAILEDDGELDGLSDGDRVFIQDTDIDFARGRATAVSIDVNAGATSSPTPTRTPTPASTPTTVSALSAGRHPTAAAA